MTRDEAVTALRNAAWLGTDADRERIEMAVDMAVETLSADGDTISRQAAIDALADYIHNVDKVYGTGKLSAEDCRDAAESVLEDLPSAQPEKAIKDCRNCKYGKYNDHYDISFCYNTDKCTDWDKWESAQPERTGRWTTDEVAELLYKMFGEECACNFNGIDEWLPMACKYAETTCPDPEEKHGCWKQFLLQGGIEMEVEHETD